MAWWSCEIANWHGLEFRNWGLVELRNCELSIRGLPGVAGTYLGFWGTRVTAIPGVVGFLVALDSAKFVCTRSSTGGFIPHIRLSHGRTEPYYLNPITYSR
jgi:hypothetical protein